MAIHNQLSTAALKMCKLRTTVSEDFRNRSDNLLRRKAHHEVLDILDDLVLQSFQVGRTDSCKVVQTVAVVND